MSKRRLIYPLVLKLYPRDFRKRFEKELMEVYEDMLNEPGTSAQRRLRSMRAVAGMLPEIVKENARPQNHWRLGVFIICIGVIVAAGAIASNFLGLVPDGLASTTVANARQGAPEKCKPENNSLSAPKEEVESIQLVVLAHLTDVPPGTKAQLTISKYDYTEAEGSVDYSGSYGSYNFAAKKSDRAERVSSSEGSTDKGWSLQKFSACQQ